MSKRQLAMVMDLNKCIGCQTCTVACKTQWTNRNGREYMYWNNVEKNQALFLILKQTMVCLGIITMMHFKVEHHLSQM